MSHIPGWRVICADKDKIECCGLDPNKNSSTFHLNMIFLFSKSSDHPLRSLIHHLLRVESFFVDNLFFDNVFLRALFYPLDSF